MTRHRLLPGATALLLALAAAGCSDDGGTGSRPTAGAASSSAPAEDAPTYVALGDSFTAAPGVPPQAGGPCGRSEVNYPNLVAEAEGYDLVDVSCSGATSADVLGDQLDAVTAETDLVTVSIGGNDESLFGQLAFGCPQLAADDPDGSPCADLGRAALPRTLRTIEENNAEVLAAVQRAAPDARVVVVSYPRLLPARGTCRDLAPFATGDYPFADEVNKGVVDAQRRAARAAGVDFADVYAASTGHDVCADDPWVNGAETAPDGTIPFHPFAVGQAAMADVVEALLR